MGLVVGQRAHHQQAVPQLGQIQKAECHCICGTCSEGLLPWPKAPVEETSPERAWPHITPLNGGYY